MDVDITKQDRIAWRRFLGSEPGINGMLWLREQIPGVGTGEPHEMIFHAGIAEGYKKAIDKVSEVLTLRDESPENLDNPALSE